MQQLTTNTLLQGGKYKIEKVLGQGGFGITYLAEQVMLGRKVAIKEFFMKDLCNRDDDTSHVSVGSTGSKEMVDRFKEKFLKEAKMIAGMDDSHIVRIYDIFEENGTAYYVMENIVGGSADKLVKDGALQISRAIKIIQEIGSALEYIHNQNILHLDVKPSNILLRPNGEAVLIDFGISKRYDVEGGQTSSTPTGISKGYAPIEQYNQGLQNFSPATDVYSLGATLYKLLTGQTPPEAPELIDGEELADCPNGVPQKVWDAVEKAMEPRRKKRFQSVHEFISMIGDQNGRTVVELKHDKEEESTVIMDGYKTSSQSRLRRSVDRCDVNIGDMTYSFRKICAGSFVMGDISSIANVTREVQLTKDYYIANVPTTQKLWISIMGNTNPFNKAISRPVVNISWNDCQFFIERLNNMTGLKFRLPSEAEWEFAAKGGIKSKGFTFAGSDDLEEVGWYDYNSDITSHNVMSLKSNELGLYDMSGNVWEWCQDWYSVLSSKKETNPYGPERGKSKVIKGGGYFSSELMCHPGYRQGESPEIRKSTIGFRLVLDID